MAAGRATAGVSTASGHRYDPDDLPAWLPVHDFGRERIHPHAHTWRRPRLRAQRKVARPQAQPAHRGHLTLWPEVGGGRQRAPVHLTWASGVGQPPRLPTRAALSLAAGDQGRPVSDRPVVTEGIAKAPLAMRAPRYGVIVDLRGAHGPRRHGALQ